MFTYEGTHFTTLEKCAREFASNALPDISVIGPEEPAFLAALDLEYYCHREEMRIRDCATIPTEGGEDAVDVATWRRMCREAITERIEACRARGHS